MTGAPGALGGDAVGLEDLRARRRQLQELDDAVSYVRRVAQGRADLARAELRRRATTATTATTTDLAGELRDVLADRLLAGPGRPPRPVEDHSDHPRAVALDELCAEHGFGRLDELDDAALRDLADALTAFEARVSDERREVFAELDALTDELVDRYRDQQTAAGAADDTPNGSADEPAAEAVAE